MWMALALPQRGWLLFLWLAWAGLLFGGLAVGRTRRPAGQRMSPWTRLGSSGALVVAAWSGYLLARHSAGGGPALCVALGMTLGAAGDLLMAGLLPVEPRLPLGMGAFGLGHVAYIVGLLSLGARCGLSVLAGYGAWAAWLLVGLAGWMLAVYRGTRGAGRESARPTALVWAALAYTLLLSSTPGVAASLALQAACLAPMALGGALFLLSDLLLAGKQFGTWQGRALDDLIWLTYGPAQMLLVYGLLLALAHLL